MGLLLTKYKEGECPEVRHKRAGDETYDICDLNDKPCLIEHGLYECGHYKEEIRRLQNE